MKAEFLQQQARENLDNLAKAFRATLVDFGYTVDQEHVKSAVQHALANQPPKGIIEMFVHDWLKDGTDDS